MGVEIVDFDVRGARIDGLLVVTPRQITDERGTICELFRRSAFESVGVSLAPFQQINVTSTRRGAVRGMHGEQMAKLLTVVAGEAFGVYVDLRPAAPTFGVVDTVALRPGVEVLVPPGVANGFQALTDDCQYAYCFDDEWRPDMPGVSCSPIGLGVEWPIAIDVDDPTKISAKDAGAPSLDDLRDEAAR